MRLYVLGGAVVLAALLAACSSGTTQYVNIPAPLPSSSPSPTPTATPTPTFTQSTNSSVTAGTAVALPSAYGYSGSMTIPSAGSTVPSSSTMSLILTNIQPSSIATLSVHQSAQTQSSALLFMGVTPNNAIVAGPNTALTFTLPAAAAASGTQFYLACYDSNARTWSQCAGPSALSSTNAIAFSFTNGFSLSANTQYWFGLQPATGSGSVVIQEAGRK